MLHVVQAPFRIKLIKFRRSKYLPQTFYAVPVQGKERLGCSILQMQNVGGTLKDQLRIVGDHQGTDRILICACDLLCGAQQIFSVLAAGGLIVEQEPATAGQGDTQGQPLLLPTGKRSGMAAFQPRKPQSRQDLPCVLFRTVGIVQRQLSQHRIGKQLVSRFLHHQIRQAGQRFGRCRFPSNSHRSPEPQKPAQGQQQGGFSRPVSPNHRNDGPFGDLQV